MGPTPSSFQPYSMGNQQLVGIVMRCERLSLEEMLFPSQGYPHQSLLMEEKLRIARDIARVLSELHSIGFVHGDIKPNNIVLSEHNPPIVRIADFGQSSIKPLSSQSVNVGTSFRETHTIKGTKQYLAPEILKRFLDFDFDEKDPACKVAAPSRSTDVYSFAMLLHELLSRQRPFASISTEAQLAHKVCNEDLRPALADLPADTPPDMGKILQACWSSNRGGRLSALEVATRLDQMYLVVQKDQFDILFSHPWVDKPLLSHVHRLLSRRGFRVWYDQTNMGHDLEGSMMAGIDHSRVVLACINSRYQDRRNCMFELETASSRQKAIVTLVTQSNPFDWANNVTKGLCNFQGRKFVDIGDLAAEKWEPDKTGAMTDAVPTADQLHRLAAALEPLLRIIEDDLRVKPSMVAAGPKL